MVPQVTRADRRTWALAWYSLVLDSDHVLGALATAFPFYLQRWLEIDRLASYKAAFGFYAALNLGSTVLYLFLSPRSRSRRPRRQLGNVAIHGSRDRSTASRDRSWPQRMRVNRNFPAIQEARRQTCGALGIG